MALSRGGRLQSECSRQGGDHLGIALDDPRPGEGGHPAVCALGEHAGQRVALYHDIGWPFRVVAEVEGPVAEHGPAGAHRQRESQRSRSCPWRRVGTSSAATTLRHCGRKSPCWVGGGAGHPGGSRDQHGFEGGAVFGELVDLRRRRWGKRVSQVLPSARFRTWSVTRSARRGRAPRLQSSGPVRQCARRGRRSAAPAPPQASPAARPQASRLT